MLDLIDLTHDECLDLLRVGLVGRVAFTTPSGPQIMPVNYAVIDDHVIIKTSPYTQLGTHGRDCMLAFEVDLVDYDQQHGWSVLARGHSAIVTDPATRRRIQNSWAPRPWAVGARSTLLSMAITELSGRQLGEGWNAMSSTAFTRRPAGTATPTA